MANIRLDEVKRSHVLAAARAMGTQSIRRWGVIVKGREYPAKKLLEAAANSVPSRALMVKPTDCSSQFAVRRLQRLGFETKHHTG